MIAIACPTTVQQPDGGPSVPNSGDLVTCESVADCPDPNNYDCLGICLQRCASNGACRATEFCSPRGYCEAGCRDSSTCEQDFVCVSGACKDASAAGSCGSKCDCGQGQICVKSVEDGPGVCQQPPESCAGPNDCGRGPSGVCEAYQCNGFTSQCFDPDPQPCAGPADCLGRPGCQSGCACTPAGQCVPDVACQVASEDADCGTGFYCNDNLACDVLPTCASSNDCPSGLVCNSGNATCQRPRPCSTSAECSTPPATFCNTGLAMPRCDIPTCRNGGVTCNANEDCAEDGRCVPEGTGTPCASDTDCPNDPWPQTQFCSFASAMGQCALGCRTNASCSAGQICNGARQCASDVGGGGSGNAGQFGASCASDSDCLAGLVCGLFTQTCAEPCESRGQACAGDPSCCPLSGAAQCNNIGFCQN